MPKIMKNGIEYGGGGGFTTLWTNPNPNTSFTDSTVNNLNQACFLFDPNEYDMICIEFKISATRNYCTNIIERIDNIPKQPTALLCAFDGTNTFLVQRGTYFKMIGSDLGISFYSAYKHISFDGSTDTADDSLLIPLRAVGIRL